MELKEKVAIVTGRAGDRQGDRPEVRVPGRPGDRRGH